MTKFLVCLNRRTRSAKASRSLTTDWCVAFAAHFAPSVRKIFTVDSAMAGSAKRDTIRDVIAEVGKGSKPLNVVSMKVFSAAAGLATEAIPCVDGKPPCRKGGTVTRAFICERGATLPRGSQWAHQRLPRTTAGTVTLCSLGRGELGSTVLTSLRRGWVANIPALARAIAGVSASVQLHIKGHRTYDARLGDPASTRMSINDGPASVRAVGSNRLPRVKRHVAVNALMFILFNHDESITRMHAKAKSPKYLGVILQRLADMGTEPRRVS